MHMHIHMHMVLMDMDMCMCMWRNVCHVCHVHVHVCHAHVMPCPKIAPSLALLCLGHRR